MSSDQTRARIVSATADLHEEVGPADTTITAIAKRAGVQRLTVYRHFPDTTALIHACSSHWADRHPLPDPSSWSGIPDPAERLRSAITAIYAYFRNGHPMLKQVLRDEESVPELAEVMAPWWEYMREVAGGLAAGWGADADGQRLVRAAVGHALDFRAWRSLSSQEIPDDEAVELMVGFVAGAAGRSRGDGPPVR